MMLLTRASGDTASVSRFHAGAAARSTAAAAPTIEDRLHARVADLEAEVRALNARAEQDRADAEAEGHRRALADMAAERDLRLAALEAALTEARAELPRLIDERRDMAIAIARAAVAAVLGAEHDRAGLVAQVARAASAHIPAASVVRLRVSAADFADDASLAPLGELQFAIERDSTLASGDCRFDLTLGEADLDLSRQAAAVDAILRDYASVDVAP